MINEHDCDVTIFTNSSPTRHFRIIHKPTGIQVSCSSNGASFRVQAELMNELNDLVEEKAKAATKSPTVEVGPIVLKAFRNLHELLSAQLHMGGENPNYKSNVEDFLAIYKATARVQAVINQSLVPLPDHSDKAFTFDDDGFANGHQSSRIG